MVASVDAGTGRSQCGGKLVAPPFRSDSKHAALLGIDSSMRKERSRQAKTVNDTVFLSCASGVQSSFEDYSDCSDGLCFGMEDVFCPAPEVSWAPETTADHASWTPGEHGSVKPEHLLGLWIDFRGKPIEVFYTDSVPDVLYAMLTSSNGSIQSVPLQQKQCRVKMDHLDFGWSCGSASMTDFSIARAAVETDFLVSRATWTFPNGDITVWTCCRPVASAPSHCGYQQGGMSEKIYGACLSHPILGTPISAVPAQCIAVPVIVPDKLDFALVPDVYVNGQQVLAFSVQMMPIAGGKQQQPQLFRQFPHPVQAQKPQHSQQIDQPPHSFQAPQGSQDFDLHHAQDSRESQREQHEVHSRQLQPQRQQSQPNSEHLPATGSIDVISRVWPLAQSALGCWQVQVALDEADGDMRVAIANELRGHIWEAVENSHANHVLQKCIVKLDPEASRFIVDELVLWGPGGATYLARHNFGCRIFNRLVEHCSADALEPLFDEVLSKLRVLCEDRYGNFVVQTLLEFGSEAHRHRLVEQMVLELRRMCMYNHAASVVRKALQHGSVEEILAIARELLRSPQRIAQMAHQRFGHALVLQLFAVPGAQERLDARQIFATRLASLQGSRYGRLVAHHL